MTLIEAGDVPSGASGRNVGLVNAGMWIPPDDIREVLGEEIGERANTILGGAPAVVFSLIERHGRYGPERCAAPATKAASRSTRQGNA